MHNTWNRFIFVFLVAILGSNLYSVDYSNYFVILKARQSAQESLSVSRMLVGEIYQNTSQNLYEFIKFLGKSSDQNIKFFEPSVLILLEDLMSGKTGLDEEAVKIAKKRLLFILSRSSLASQGDAPPEPTEKKSGIYLYFPLIRNNSYRPDSTNISSLIREKAIEFLDGTSKFVIVHDKVSVLKNKDKIDYILDIGIQQYEFSVRNHFDRYTDGEDRCYYRYDYSDLDLDIRVDMKLVKYSTGSVVSSRSGFFSRTGTLHMYPGDYRFYGDVPYYWRESQGMSVYDNYRSDLHDFRYNPYFNDFDQTLKTVVDDIVYDHKDGIVKFLIDQFPIRARIARLDENPDFVWINAGKQDGIYHQLRFSILKKTEEGFVEASLLRARTINENTTRCRIHNSKGSTYSPAVGDRVISSGY